VKNKKSQAFNVAIWTALIESSPHARYSAGAMHTKNYQMAYL
jgi:hypothetical protein